MIRQISSIILTNFLFFNVFAVGSELLEIQKAVEEGIKNGIARAVKAKDDNYTLLKYLAYAGIGCGFYIVWKKYGPASKRDVKRELVDGVQLHTKKEFDRVRKQSTAQFNKLENDTSQVESGLQQAGKSLMQIKAASRLQSMQRTEKIQQLNNQQNELLTKYWNKSDSLIFNSNQIKEKSEEIMNCGDRLLSSIRAEIGKKQQTYKHMTTQDQIFDNLLTEIENETSNNDDLISLNEENQLSLAQIDDRLTKNVSKLQLLSENAQVLKQLNDNEEYQKINWKIDRNVEQAKLILTIVKKYNINLDEYRKQLEEIRKENREWENQLKSNNEQFGPNLSDRRYRKRPSNSISEKKSIGM